MKDILFRGKREDGGGWVYGSLVQSSKFKDGHVDSWIIEKRPMMLGIRSTPTDLFRPVNTATVGQYIGRKDRNENMIFTGDKLDYFEEGEHNEAKMVASFVGREFLNVCPPDSGYEYTIRFDSTDDEDMEIIGNIHDEEVFNGK